MDTKYEKRWEHMVSTFKQLKYFTDSPFYLVLYDNEELKKGSVKVTKTGLYIDYGGGCLCIWGEKDPALDHGLHTTGKQWNKDIRESFTVFRGEKISLYELFK